MSGWENSHRRDRDVEDGECRMYDLARRLQEDLAEHDFELLRETSQADLLDVLPLLARRLAPDELRAMTAVLVRRLRYPDRCP